MTKQQVKKNCKEAKRLHATAERIIDRAIMLDRCGAFEDATRELNVARTLKDRAMRLLGEANVSNRTH